MIPQLVIPSKGNPYYNTKSTGGYNPCILGNPQRRVQGLNVLPNCVGYAVARFNELGEYGKCKWLGNTNACNFISLAKKQGLEITDEPTQGGVMVWTGGEKNLGHVACVEMPLYKGKIITSESEYYGKPFVVYARSGSNWSDGCYWMGKSYKYAGCIKNPAVQEETELTEDDVKRIVKQMFPALFEEYIYKYMKMLKSADADEYAEKALAWAKDMGIMIGDKSGNQMPQAFVKREDLACVLYSLMVSTNGE